MCWPQWFIFFVKSILYFLFLWFTQTTKIFLQRKFPDLQYTLMSLVPVYSTSTFITHIPHTPTLLQLAISPTMTQTAHVRFYIYHKSTIICEWRGVCASMSGMCEGLRREYEGVVCVKVRYVCMNGWGRLCKSMRCVWRCEGFSSVKIWGGAEGGMTDRI